MSLVLCAFFRSAFVTAILARREEGFGREADLAEKLAGIAVALFDADLFGHTEIVYGDKHLNLALDLDDHEDAECCFNCLFGAVVVEVSAESSCDAARYAAAAGAVTALYKTCTKAYRLCDLAYDLRKIAGTGVLDVVIAADVIGTEDLDASFASEEYGLFVIHRKSVDLARVADRGYGDINADGEIDGKVNTVISAVKGYGLGVDIDVDDLGALHSYTDGIIYHFLVALSEIDGDVFKTFSVAACVVNAAGVYTYCFTETVTARIGFAVCHY